MVLGHSLLKQRAFGVAGVVELGFSSQHEYRASTQYFADFSSTGASSKTAQVSGTEPFGLRGQRRSSGSNTLGVFHVLVNLVEVQVLEDRRAILVHDVHGIQVSGNGRDVKAPHQCTLCAST